MIKRLSAGALLQGPSGHCQEEVAVHNQAIPSPAVDAVPFLSFFRFLTERLWVPSGPVNGRCHARRVLHHGPAMVCGCYGPLHHSCQQSETGIRVFSSRRTTQISWHSGTKGYRAHDFYSYGFISLYDQYSEGNEICTYEFEKNRLYIYLKFSAAFKT